MIARVSVAVLCLSLGACAASNVKFSKLPPETPAAKNAAALETAKAFAAAMEAASAQDSEAIEPPPSPPLTLADVPSMDTYDPWERLNRFTYRFNARFDDYVFLPVVNGYGHLPRPVRAGVHNFFGNLAEVANMTNFALQGRGGYSARSLGRFVINSTIGIGGLFDVAKKLKLKPASTGFATTLSKWGMRPGPFLVIPFYGPATLRDGVGLIGDFGTSYAFDTGGLYRASDKSWLTGVGNAVDKRAHIAFRYNSTGSPFEYEMIRFLYVRRLMIEDEGLHVEDPSKLRVPYAPAGE
jgi:phospholipid-binding lipoprotein MlaA